MWRKNMKLIAAVDRNWGIGFNNELLANIPSDKRYFKSLTEHQVIVMGRKTYESLPGKRPLENRVNIILTSDKKFQAKGFEAVHSTEELLEHIKQYNGKEIFVAGGQSVYEQLHSFCDEAYITKINYAYHADRYCPNLDRDKNWKLVGMSEEETYYDLEYYFCKYRNRNLE